LAVDNYLKANPTSYPIVLSLENHCSHPYQRAMADIMKETFGKKLFIPSKEQTSGGNLPSPEELRGMVVIKGKRPPDPDEDDASMDKTGNMKPATSHSADNDEVDEYEEALEKPKKSKIDQELAKLTLFHGCKYKSFTDSISTPPSHMHSIGETKIKKILDKSKDNAKLWRKYNVQHLTRTYPAGTRVDSSNYNPVLAWSMGCQLVALNFQTPDTPLVLNDGMFRRNAGCGYIEKPASVMGGTRPIKVALKVSILSAHCLPKPMGAKAGELVDPYISVEMHDVCISGDSATEEHMTTTSKTSAVKNNGFCPVWNDANFTFNVETPDVAMLMFKIVDDDYGYDDIIASSAIPFSCLRQGYRSVQLYDQNNTRTGPFQYATLFVKISMDKL
jgi:phosphatidylinositol phospholipase C delta